MISYIDDQILSIKNVLEKTGLDKNTIIIFTADHGEMMGERGMWYKQHFFEWASKIPLIIYAPNRFKPSKINKNVSLINLLPTFIDIVTDGKASELLNQEIDGQSLYPSLQGLDDNLDDVAISEFAADGSTGPSKMIKKGNYKYMYLEGVDELLYDLKTDPDEIKNLINEPQYAEIAEELRLIAFKNWDPNILKKIIQKDQERRLFIHKTTNGIPTWVNMVRIDDAERYVRNGSAADTKAKARFPFVNPAKPDIKK
jgi:choline-sulfatase